ncbi:MAG: beta-galactosidase [Acidobacteriota bacterium]|nr:beta-galactosidase [Acidobacteriota bacterium]
MNRRTFHKVAGAAGFDLAFAAAAPFQAAGNAERGRWDRYLIGAAYYPEWWPAEEWEVDFREMRDLGINTVRMGEFAWALFETAPGKFDFDWMDRALAIAERHGIRAILCTPTASIPPWLYAAHPDVLTGNAAGAFTYGGRKGYNTNSANYLAASARITIALAERYGRHPNVIGWQLDNEPGHPPQSYDPVSEKAFQSWLKERYGTLEELNRVWNGAFWSNRFSDWTQIRFPGNSAEGGWQPAISLDYRRFFSDSFLQHLRAQAGILHAKTQNQFVFTNWPAPTWSVDVFEAAKFLDATAWDNYVSAPGVSRFQRQYTAGFLSDFCRCAGPRQKFLCAEQNAYAPPNAPAEGLRLQAYEDFAHGGHGQLYFEWRRPLAGGEEHRPSFIKGFDGKVNPAKPVLARICRELERTGALLAGAETRADIAMLYDFSNEWAQGYGGVGDNHPRYNAEMQSFYAGMKVLGRNIDVVPLGADYSRYKAIVASNLRLVDDATVERLRAFVAAGGTLVLNYRAATQNRDNSMRRTLAPGPFAEMAGVRSEAMLDLFEYNAAAGNLDAELQAGLGIQFGAGGSVFRPRTAIESLKTQSAEAIATVRGGGPMDGGPAVVRNRYRKGTVFYAGCDSTDDGFYETLARMVGEASSLKPPIAVPYGVEVTSRENAGTIWYFLLNLTQNAHERIALPHPMDDVTGERGSVAEIALGPFDAAVLASRK